MPPREDAVRTWPRIAWWLAALAFVVLATLNSAGYRFGAGDQAFYLPAVERHLDAGSFPRDRILIDDQDRLNVFPRAAAALIRATGVSESALFLALHVLALLLLFWAARALCASLGLSPWAQLAAVSALTLKHRVGMTGANTLEGYSHPRMLAFALGLAAVVFVLRSRPGATLALLAAAFVVHPTTALWTGVWALVALAATAPRWRPWLLAAGAGWALAAIWAVGWGPFAARMVRMDDAWLSVLEGKDYLFATRWPADMWVLAVLYAVLPPLAFAVRRRTGSARPGEGAMVLGLAALVAIFLVTLPLVAQRIAFAVQLQISRVFWMLDLVAIVYVAWALADAGHAEPKRAATRTRRAAAVAFALICIASARGAWVMWVEHPGRPVVQAGLPHDEWQDAMAWLRRQPLDTHVLADPSHAWRHDTSVRVAAQRDVYLEEVKDSAMALYSRRAAMRVAERTVAVGDFAALTPEAARGLAARFGLDVLVTERPLDLPLAYRNARFSIYRLRP